MALAYETALCLDCDQPIPPARLAAVPDAVRCVTCQAEGGHDVPYVAERLATDEDESSASAFELIRRRLPAPKVPVLAGEGPTETWAMDSGRRAAGRNRGFGGSK